MAAKRLQNWQPISWDTPLRPVYADSNDSPAIQLQSTSAKCPPRRPTVRLWAPKWTLIFAPSLIATSLPDYAENDINTVTNIARIMVQDVSDVFRVIEQRGFEAPRVTDQI